MASTRRSKRTPIAGTAAARSRDLLTERTARRHEGDRPSLRPSVTIARVKTRRVPARRGERRFPALDWAFTAATALSRSGARDR
jgi:hypothetical protein